uniref:Carboxylic ester hydrolase n=1 Tax=Globodera pallida TaxID=36090 RepID=A0A183BSV7_GLOPA
MAPKLSNSHNELLFFLILCPALIKFASSSAFVPIEEFSTVNEEESIPSIVTVRNGKIRGFRRELEPALDADKVLFEQADIFLGIPFAQPPVDKLRLERPLAASNWTGTLDATALPAPCVPQQLLTALNFDENCLQLNVMRPASAPSGDASPYQLPVLVFIHGGAFIIGGTFVEGYANISNNFVAQGIVVVTVQYRLNFLGFFTDGTERNPGNLGLWDQRQALLWVRDNIGAFGGDPNRVTVWGQSAGAASTSILALSPLTRDLFQQTIQMSGASLCPWAMNDLVRDESARTAEEIGCGMKGEQSVRDCVKRVELEDLVDAIQQLELFRLDLAMTRFNPRVDGEFVPSANLSVLFRTAPPKPTLMGFTPHEALFLTIQNPNSLLSFASPLTVSNLSEFGRDRFVKIIQRIVHLESIGRNANVREAEEEKRQILEELIQFYASEPPTNNDTAHWLKRYTLFLSDALFIMPILAEARLKAELGWPVFLHQFDHVNKGHAKLLPFPGVAHTAEYAFTLGVPLLGNYALDEEDKRVRATMAHAYGTFVKNGVPNTLNGETNWPRLGSDRRRSLQLTRIKYPNPVTETEPTDVAEKLKFWRKLSTLKGYGGMTGFTKELP